MSKTIVGPDGIEYDLAPMEPELWDRPSPGFIVVITPAIADSWLKYNRRNRNQRKRGLNDYGADMAQGNFKLNGSSITFSRPLEAGEDEDVPAGCPVLIDGQHRLEACVDSGTPFQTYVMYGFPPEVRDTVDGGIRRTFQDNLTMKGEVNTAVLASVTMRCYYWSMGDRHLTLRREGVTRASLEEFLDEHPEMRRSAHIAKQVYSEFINSGIKQSVTGLAHWLFMQADPTLAPEFFARLGDGAEMPKSHPIMQIRRRIMKDKRDRELAGRRGTSTPDWQQLVYMIRGWNALLQDRSEFALTARNDRNVMPSIQSKGNLSQETVTLLDVYREENVNLPQAS